uniref:Uncharacterized protein n=1 Tax=Cajanus cajan TaxID=3821 RepID=A0A151T2D6_CAJCA|nr:hypothetical protein KK1_023664 [Cajanus cajan]
MMTPNLNLEPENHSEGSSQVASNVSLHEASHDLTKGSTTTSSCLTKDEPDPGSITLDLTLNFNSNDSHSAMHRRHVSPSLRAPDMRAAAKFEKNHFGSLVFMEDDDVGFFWPGSFRQVDQGGSVNVAHAQSSNASLVPMVPPPPQASASPDLTLKL